MGPIIIINIAGLILYGAEAMGQAFILTCTLPSLIIFWIISIDKKGSFFADKEGQDHGSRVFFERLNVRIERGDYNDEKNN